jgi:hypothetical protein
MSEGGQFHGSSYVHSRQVLFQRQRPLGQGITGMTTPFGPEGDNTDNTDNTGDNRDGMDRRAFITIAHDFWDHPKMVALEDPDTAGNTLLRLITYSNQYKTDGKIDKKVLKKFKKRLVEKLLKVGFLEPTEDPDVYVIHDYLKHQKSREQIEELKAKKSEAGAKGMHKRWHVAKGRVVEDCTWCVAEAITPVTVLGAPRARSNRQQGG